MPDVLALGHSTQPLETLVDALRRHGVEELWDVRVMPYSRRNPQFARETLAAGVEAAGIRYVSGTALGGFRRPRPDSPNVGWRNSSFRGYADYMLTPEFESAIDSLVKTARTRRVAILCAEAVPWRCHRSLIADALAVRGVSVRHLFPGGVERPHERTPWARVEGTRLVYPSEGSRAPRRKTADRPGQRRFNA